MGTAVAGRVGQARWRIADWVVPHSHADKPGGTTEERDRPRNPRFQCREIKPQNTCEIQVKTPVGGAVAAGETPSLTGEFIRETHRVLEHTQTHPHRNQHQKSPICFWVAGEVTESRSRAQKVALFPLGPSPTYSVTMQPCGLPHPGEHLRFHPLLPTRPPEAKKNGLNERSDQSSRKNTAK